MPVLRLGDKEWKQIQDRRRYGLGLRSRSLPSLVVTIDGQIVLCFDANDQVTFQDDRFPIADLVRAKMKVVAAMRDVNHYDLADLKRERSGKPSGMEILAQWAREAATA